MRTIVGHGSLNICIQKCESFNDPRVSKRDVKSFGSQYVLDGGIQNTCI